MRVLQRLKNSYLHWINRLGVVVIILSYLFIEYFFMLTYLKCNHLVAALKGRNISAWLIFFMANFFMANF